MRLAGIFSSLVVIVGLGGCATSPAGALTLGDLDDCSGVTLVVDYGLLASEADAACVEFGASEALAKEVLSFGLDTEGTGTYGDAIVCRVNGLPSESEPFVVEGEAPHAETCADMPPAFGYWALWIKDTPTSEWAPAQEGVGTLQLTTGNQVGLVFSTGGDTPTPTDP